MPALGGVIARAMDMDTIHSPPCVAEGLVLKCRRITPCHQKVPEILVFILVSTFQLKQCIFHFFQSLV